MLQDGKLDDKFVVISDPDITPAEPERRICEEVSRDLMGTKTDIPLGSSLEVYLKLAAEAEMAGRPWGREYLRLKISEARAWLEEKYLQAHPRFESTPP